VQEHHGSVQHLDFIPDDVRAVLVCAHDIAPEDHVLMQGVVQSAFDAGGEMVANSLSKTINLPNRATVGDVYRAYSLAFETGCKGITVYRDGSRDAQVLSTGKTGGEKPTMTPTSPPVTPPAGAEAQPQNFSSLAEARNGRPRTLTGVTKKIRTGHGSMYVTMNDDEFGPRECFVILGKPGGTAAAFSDALGRMITMALTHGATPAEVVHQLRGIQDGHPAGVGPNAVLSVPDGVARAMSENYLIEDTLPDTRELPIIGACPDCGSGLTRQEGCVVCHSCGYSKCS
jgi:ribonucleoside-diphosphate reductase alpha chain